MDALQAILTRRSIRRFQPGRPLSAAQIDTLMQAAMAAPSAANEQPWEFIVIDDRETLEKFQEHHPYSKMLSEASCGILVCADKYRDKLDGYLQQDCSAATHNILLAAHAMGLGAVWLGVYPRVERVEAVRQIIGAPENILPFAMIAVGYPAENKGPAERYEAARVHKNRW